MPTHSPDDRMVDLLRHSIASLVRHDGPDLTARQLGVLLACYLQNGPHTVRGLAAELSLSKPAITRALDRLGQLELVRRLTDPADRRSVLVQRTVQGQAFLKKLRGIVGAALTTSAPVEDVPATRTLHRSAINT